MPLEARRSDLNPEGQNLDRPNDIQHPGLVLDRYLKFIDDDHDVQKVLYARLERTEVRDIYRRAYRRWEQRVQNWDGCRAYRGTLSGPMAIGLGNESVVEVGLTLHHTYGMPVIPGSALKGLCRRGLSDWRETPAGKAVSKTDYEELHRTLFGDTEQASSLVFWDSWYDHERKQDKDHKQDKPLPLKPLPLHRDTITVHHPDYYNKGQAWPTDFDDPNPVPFLSVNAGVSFLFALTTPSGWEDFAWSLLKWSLENLGVGGKTNAGYGYFDNDAWSPLPFLPLKTVQVETIQGCTILRDGNEALLSIPPQEIISITAEDWQRLTATWTPEQRQAASEEELTVMVIYHIEKEQRTLTQILPEGK